MILHAGNTYQVRGRRIDVISVTLDTETFDFVLVIQDEDDGRQNFLMASEFFAQHPEFITH